MVPILVCHVVIYILLEMFAAQDKSEFDLFNLIEFSPASYVHELHVAIANAGHQGNHVVNGTGTPHLSN